MFDKQKALAKIIAMLLCYVDWGFYEGFCDSLKLAETDGWISAKSINNVGYFVAVGEVEKSAIFHMTKFNRYFCIWSIRSVAAAYDFRFFNHLPFGQQQQQINGNKNSVKDSLMNIEI